MQADTHFWLAPNEIPQDDEHVPGMFGDDANDPQRYYKEFLPRIEALLTMLGMVIAEMKAAAHPNIDGKDSITTIRSPVIADRNRNDDVVTQRDFYSPVAQEEHRRFSHLERLYRTE